MKTRFFFSMIVMMMVCTVAMAGKSKSKSYAELKGNSMSEFGNYSISKSETPMVVDNQEVRTYNLSYDKTGKDISVGIVPTKKCRNFIVKTDVFEIEYVCNKGVFGVKKIEPAYSSIDKSRNEANLDMVQYFAQRVISQSPKSEEELLGLIACYFPHLIKDDCLAKF
jgi:hypothetical protein